MGIFTTIQNALQAEKEYITKLEKEGDQYKEQGYHEVDLEKDVRIEKCHKEFAIITNKDYIYSICYSGYGFGQSIKSIKGWCSSEAINEIFPNKVSIETGINVIFGGIGSFHVDPLPINKLRIGNITHNKLNVSDQELIATKNKLDRFDIVLC